MVFLFLRFHFRQLTNIRYKKYKEKYTLPDPAKSRREDLIHSLFHNTLI